jgi:hypothetical protein
MCLTYLEHDLGMLQTINHMASKKGAQYPTAAQLSEQFT